MCMTNSVQLRLVMTYLLVIYHVSCMFYHVCYINYFLIMHRTFRVSWLQLLMRSYFWKELWIKSVE
uniref:Transmembrane protein n=2 Tax=Arabidopsis thaliana TaxID=3702 RepID=Q1PEQ0_ARATH|nr:hypothetical protein At3g15600 [Arabidopsis thaliana]